MLLLSPDIKVPVWPKPIVESTVITDDPAETLPITFDFGEILNVPSIKSTSLNPMNRPIL